MNGAGISFDRVATRSKSADKAINQLRPSLLALTSQLTGTSPVASRLAGVIGEFAYGGVLATGVVLGITAIAGAYALLTKGAREAREENKKLVDALGEQFLPKTGPRSKTEIGYQAALKAKHDLRLQMGILQNSSNDFEVAGKYREWNFAAPTRTRLVEMERVRTELARVQQIIDDVHRGSIGKLETVTVTARDMQKVLANAHAKFAEGIRANLEIFDSLAAHGQASKTVNTALISDYGRIADQIRNMGDAATPARLALLELRDALAANLVVSQHIAAINSTGTVGPLVGKTLPGVGVTATGAIADARGTMRGHTPTVGGVDPVANVESAIERQARQDKENAERLTNAIQGTAVTIASVVGNAILQVGNSRGSQIGGAIGGAIGGGIGAYYGGMAGTAIGGVMGAAVGSVIPVVGTIIGGYLGSAIGGLFGGHKKAVNDNTAAVRALTQSMTQYAPDGFKIEPYRYAADPGRMRAGQRAGSGGITIIGDVHVHDVQDPDALWSAVLEGSGRNRARGGATGFAEAA